MDCHPLTIQRKEKSIVRKPQVYPLVFIALLAAASLLSGCYWNTQVEAYQVGLVMPDGVKVESVVSAGRYTHMGFYAELKKVDVSAKTVEWEDPDLVTADKQPIGLKIVATYARMRDADNAKAMYELYHNEATSDEALAQQVLTRIPGVAKAVTVRYTLDEMLGISASGEVTAIGREKITSDLFDLLSKELDEVHVALLDIRVSNIAPDPEYLERLKEKARADVEKEVAHQRTKQLEEQLKQEEAQTAIELEKARRQNQVNEELAKVYELNPQFYELEKLKIIRDTIGDNDKLIFIPPGTDLTLLWGGKEGVVPVVP